MILWNIISNTTVFYVKYIVKYSLFLWCKAAFSASLLQSLVSHDSFRNHSNMLTLMLNKHFFATTIISVENSSLIFRRNHDTFFHLINKNFCNIVFTVNSDQFNASLMNKIRFFPFQSKQLSDPKLVCIEYINLNFFCKAKISNSFCLLLI